MSNLGEAFGGHYFSEAGGTQGYQDSIIIFINVSVTVFVGIR